MYARELSTIARIARQLSEMPIVRPLWQRVLLCVAHPYWTCAAIGAVLAVPAMLFFGGTEIGGIYWHYYIIPKLI